MNMGFLYVVVRHDPSPHSDRAKVSFPVRIYTTREAAEAYTDKLDQKWLGTNTGSYHVVVGVEHFDK